MQRENQARVLIANGTSTSVVGTRWGHCVTQLQTLSIRVRQS